MGGGGFVAGPAGLAAAITGTPLVLTEADSHLGLANRLLAGRARRVCLAFPIEGRDGSRYLVTGRPVPAAVLEADRAAARRRFGIPESARCLLVVGGSQGARSINECAVAAFAERDGPRLPRRPRRRPPRLHRAEAAPRVGPAQRPLRAARLRAEPRRRPRRERPGARPGRRLDLRDHRDGPARGPRSLSARGRRAPGDERGLDGAGRGRGGRCRRGARARSGWPPRSRGCSPRTGGWRRWPRPPAGWPSPTPRAVSPTRS